MRRLVAGLAAAAIALLLTSALLHVFGLGGWRGGFLLVFVLSALPAAGIAWWAASGAPNRWAWPATAALLAAVAAGVIADHAPVSATRLAERMDGLRGLDFFTITEQDTGGSGRCEPACPWVSRIYQAPDIGHGAALVVVGTALAHEGLLTAEQIDGLRRDHHVAAVGHDMRVEVTLIKPREPDGPPPAVKVTYAARRP